MRAKYMTLDPHKNKYVKYMGNIRGIQDYLVRKVRALQCRLLNAHDCESHQACTAGHEGRPP